MYIYMCVCVCGLVCINTYKRALSVVEDVNTYHYEMNGPYANVNQSPNQANICRS